MSTSDLLSKFLLEDRSARVISVQIEQAWTLAQTNQPQAPAVRTLMGELMAAAALLSANLKFDGSLLLQLQGNGAVKLIVVECRQDLSMRATVKLRREPKQDETDIQALLNHDGQGRFSVILNPPKDNPGRQPYQGVVPLTGQTVAQILQDYMRQSEQLDTKIWLAASDKRVAGLLLQRMPFEGGHATAPLSQLQQSWEHAQALCETVKAEELLDTDSQTLLHRLFWETPVVGLETAAITWQCGCTRARVASMLRSLGQSEIDSIIAEQGQVEVICDFCATPYRFDRVDATAVFKGVSDTHSSSIQ